MLRSMDGTSSAANATRLCHVHRFCENSAACRQHTRQVTVVALPLRQQLMLHHLSGLQRCRIARIPEESV